MEERTELVSNPSSMGQEERKRFSYMSPLRMVVMASIAFVLSVVVISVSVVSSTSTEAVDLMTIETTEYPFLLVLRAGM